jgi:hypothetical protein
VIERGRRPRFLDKTLFLVIGGKNVGRQEFQRNDAVELGVFRLIDHTHPTFTKLLEDPVMSYTGTDQGAFLFSYVWANGFLRCKRSVQDLYAAKLQGVSP